MRRRAFTVLEVLWTCALVALLLAFSLASYRPSQASSRRLAEVVAAELVAARALAIHQRLPVAARFHCQGGPLANSFSLWRGDHQPRCLKNLNLDAELPHGQIFWGVWPSSQVTLDRPALGGEAAFSVQQWFAPQPPPTDALLVFTPDGMVWSNDLPLIQGAYRLVACTGAEFSPASPGGTATVTPRPAYFALSAVQQPHTISVELNGAVHVDSGVAAQDGSVALRPCGGPTRGLTYGLGLPANATPLVTALKLSPAPPTDRPTGVDAQVGPDGHLILSVEAQDSDGDALTCEFTSNGGGFTSQGRNKMEWDATAGVWRADWVFRPNPGDAPSTRYELTCSVRDERGTPAQAAAGVELNPTFELVINDRLVFGKIPYGEIYSVNSDGSDRRVIPVMQAIRGPADFPNLSPDGSKVLLTNQQTLDLWVVNTDGSGARQLTSGRSAFGGSWSPDGSKIITAANYGAGTHLYLMPASGEIDPPVSGSTLLPPQMLAPAVEITWCQPRFNRTGTKIVTLASPNGSPLIGIYVFDLNTNTGNFLAPPEPTGASLGFGTPSYCPDPAHDDLISFTYGDGTNNRLEVMSDDGSGRTIVPLPGGQSFVSHPSWSPSGLRLSYVTDRINVSDFTVATAQLSNEKTLVDYAGAVDW